MVYPPKALISALQIDQQKAYEVSQYEVLQVDHTSRSSVFDACDRCGFGAVGKEGITPF